MGQVGPALPAVPGLGPSEGCGAVRVVEECRQQYEMVCEETVARRQQERCQEVATQTCEDTVTTEYEPACFQRIISHCDGVGRARPLYFLKNLHTYINIRCLCAGVQARRDL